MKINPYAQIIALARQQAAQIDPTPKRDQRARVSSESAQRFDLARSMFERIQEINVDDPHRRRKAFRIFLESALAREFGDALLTDPAYQGLVDTVFAQMEAEPKLKTALSRATDLLLGKN